MKTRQIESILTMSKMYHCLPSVIMHIEDEYTAFCFDEACCFIMTKLLAGETPQYSSVINEKKEYKNFKDFYEQYNGG